ncbi:MAG: hypothetical protein M1827_002691 [Pycnora praestabilis]|nr:MAG: hypothetical protein M1827_002691 [Pycnora praestabilis]
MGSPPHEAAEGTRRAKEPPARPNPAADSGVVPTISSPLGDDSGLPDDSEIDIFNLTPVAALKMLVAMIEALVLITGDVPPTPPISHPTTPNMKTIQAEKADMARSQLDGFGRHSRSHTPPSSVASDDIDSVHFRKTPVGSPEAGCHEPFTIVGAGAEPTTLQHGAIVRKFYSKKPPPIPLEEYLMRLHRYCPMSTAVYLATSLYIHKLAVIERIISVTGRNVHRLLLAGLRVAMKALEDLSYPHRRFAKVGGVSELELGRLEINFCFLTNFELRVSSEMLYDQAASLSDSARLYQVPTGFQPKIPPIRNRAKIPIREIVPSRPVQMDV